MAGQSLLITGIHRSGSTWLGQVLRNCPEFGFVWEPLNKETTCYGRFNHATKVWYPYVPGANSAEVKAAYLRLQHFDYNSVAGLKDIKNVCTFLRYFRDGWNFRRWKFGQCRLLMKDPMAFFSAEWISREINAQVIVIIRNPLAFIASMLRAGWYMPLEDIIGQDALVHAYPDDLVSEIKAFLSDGGDCYSVEACCLGWRYIHRIIVDLQSKHDDWFFIRHEDLVSEPIGSVDAIFKFLEVDPGDAVYRHLKSSLSGGGGDHGQRRDPLKLLNSYQNILSEENQQYILGRCASELNVLYPEGI